MEVETKSGIKLKGAVVNVIPPQTAGDIAIKTGCAEGAWCPIKPQNFCLRQGRWRLRHRRCRHCRRYAEVGLLGQQPRQGRRRRSPRRPRGGDPAVARYRNTCWSLLAADDSIKIGADYTPGEKDGKPMLAPNDPFVSQKGERPEVRRKNYAESLAWYHAIISDAFNDKTALTHKG